jgi:hypothetical protein
MLCVVSRGKLDAVFELSQAFSAITVPLEYGVTQSDKLKIGVSITRHLIGKILHDLRIGIHQCVCVCVCVGVCVTASEWERDVY